MTGMATLVIGLEMAQSEVTVYYPGEPIVGTSDRACGKPVHFSVSLASQSVVLLPSNWAINGFERGRAAGRQSPKLLRNCVVFDRLNWTCDGPSEGHGYQG